MYQAQFETTDDQDWSEAVELIDADTNLPLSDIDDAEFELEVRGECGPMVLLRTVDDTLGRPASNIIAWTITIAQLGSFSVRETYRVGLRMVTPEGTTQLLVGSLAIVGGGFGRN